MADDPESLKSPKDPNAPRGDAAAKAADPVRIDAASDASLDEWAKKLDATHEQIKEAIDAVGDNASDVEMHLKGTRSTTNAEREA